MSVLWVLKSPHFFLEPHQLVATGRNIHMPDIALVSMKYDLVLIDFHYGCFVSSFRKDFFKNNNVILSASSDYQLDDLTIPVGVHPCSALLDFYELTNKAELSNTISQVSKQLAESNWDKVAKVVAKLRDKPRA